MRQSRVKRRWHEGRSASCLTVQFADPQIAEIGSLLGFDCLWLDVEHSARSPEQIFNLMTATRVGASDVMARPGRGEFLPMRRLLESGAHGILYPQCESAAEAREVVRYGRFPPAGERGVGGGGADMPYLLTSFQDYLRAANENVFLAVQIETVKGLQKLDEIAAVDGVDMLFFGPVDFSVSAGVPAEFDHPAVRDAAEKVRLAAKAHGKRFGTPALDLEHVKALAASGTDLICYGSDLGEVVSGFKRLKSEMEALGFDFG